MPKCVTDDSSVPRRTGLEVDGVADQRAGHAVTAAAPAAELGADDGDDLDACLS
jgi:hypothetical protein